ncbi:hypothetical protein SMB34_19675 [Thalassospira permensis NBRC 106175]|uniref:Uncharacterized protein n=1 Tax=Thalassospira permensis NBRC 106175 TaxID=1353532 RepID=A0ABR4TLI4_9PROT|nr:hypothetical protein SMB34_19675 [Thalassospira permensis NBRC 106175]
MGGDDHAKATKKMKGPPDGGPFSTKDSGL